MKVKCDYCQQLVDETAESCPHCGAPMPTTNRTASEQPKTIAELQQWYKDRNLPPENVTRFFIGKDVREAKAFGIYKNSNGDFVVYKNKSDGSRAVRYQGSDEEYAVNEIYQKLKAEIASQKSRNSGSGSSKSNDSSGGGCLSSFIVFILWALLKPIGFTIIAIIIGVLIAIFDHSPSEGYYRYQGNDYYYQGSSWYAYDEDSDSWDRAFNSSVLDDLINDETDSDYRYYGHSGSDFEDSSWYDDYDSDSDSSYSYSWDSGSSWNSSWNSDSSWDWDSGNSWNSGGSWNSNW
ncbi:MAG: zinc ribbon domain-containing protein [Lachnospiraceae bacterium]|nr:zinc ribbon domain-containing protein [Lachnospiraceae bacterium]